MTKKKPTIEQCIGRVVSEMRARPPRSPLALSQRELASHAMFPHSTIAQIEAGRRLKHSHLIAIARAFGIGYAELIAKAEEAFKAR